MRPSIYINLHQTIAVCLAAGVVLAYLFDFRGFRRSVNFMVTGMSEVIE